MYETSQQKRAARNLFLSGIALLALVALAAGVWFAGRGKEDGKQEEIFVRELATFPTSELEGTVESVSGDTFVLEVSAIGAISVPKDSPLRKRQVRISSDTVIAVRETKSEEELQRERAENGFPPLSFRLVPMRADDLHAGDWVRVVEQGYPDLRMKREIAAYQIVREPSR